MTDRQTDGQTDRRTDRRGKTICLPTLKGGDITKLLKTNGSLMKVKSLLEHSAILLTCIK